MLGRINYRQFVDWEAYFDLDLSDLRPIDSARLDWQFAYLRQTIADVFRGKDQKHPEIDNFMLKFVKKATPEEKLKADIAALESFVKVWNYAVLKEQKKEP